MKTKLRHSSWPNMILQPHMWTLDIVVFMDGIQTWIIAVDENGYEHCFSGKAVCITFSECMFVSLGIQHAKLLPHFVICGLSGSAIFFPCISKTALFKKNVIDHKMCFGFLGNICLKHFSFSEESSETVSQMYVCLYVKYPLFLPDFNETWIFSTDFFF
jgi:hypothetical protein